MTDLMLDLQDRVRLLDAAVKQYSKRGQTYTARHEVFGAANRQRSKLDGLWVCLCPEHHEEIHRDARKALALKRFAQNKAMDFYGWTVDDFRQRYGKNYL